MPLEQLASVLGPLEADVMDAAWGSGAVTVRAVLDALNAVPGREAYSFNTIMTVMNRLVAKQLLGKRLESGTYVYAPAVTRDAFSAQVSRSVS